jgi:hypothetical protein
MLFRSLNCVCIVSLGCSQLGCGSTKTMKEEEYTTVAQFTPAHRNAEAFRRSEEELNRILSDHGIEFGLDGSRTYNVIVPSARAKEARELLRAARLKSGGELKVR